MKKLIRGIVDFHRHVKPDYAEKFAKLALGQSPDSLFIACSDSRVVPNLFASSDPGDLFVVRNVGNLIPPCDEQGHSYSDESEAAALEFSLGNLNVSDIVVCGHSECGAMQALLKGREAIATSNLRAWLRHAENALAQLHRGKYINAGLTPHNALSQLNTLLQMQHLHSYPIVRERMAKGKLRLHSWWFDIAHAEVYAYDEAASQFIPINEQTAPAMLKKL